MGRFRDEEDKIERLLMDYYKGNIDRKIELLEDKLESIKEFGFEPIKAYNPAKIRSSTNEVIDSVSDNVIRKEEKITEIKQKIKLLKYFKSQLKKVIEIEINREVDKELLQIAYSSNKTLLQVAQELGYSESHVKRRRKELVKLINDSLFDFELVYKKI